MENGSLARVNLIGTKGRPGTVPGVPLKGLRRVEDYLFSDLKGKYVFNYHLREVLNRFQTAGFTLNTEELV
jgi:hypothetical protein